MILKSAARETRNGCDSGKKDALVVNVIMWQKEFKYTRVRSPIV